MDTSNLTRFYDDLKTKLGNDSAPSGETIKVSGNPVISSQTPGALVWRNQAAKEREKLEDGCRKHILLDIYCKILPLDQDYIHGHQSQMNNDIDNMLSNKGMTASQYLTSCYESTHAPLVEFLLRSTNNIGRQFMEDANETLKDAQENDVEIPEPKADLDSKEIEDQLVDVKSDSEYETFIDKLKEKTVNKIVSDVTKIINNKKEEKEMTFDPKPTSEVNTESSTIAVGLDYIERKLIMENVDINPEMQEEMIGMAIREATLNQIDTVFRRPEADFKVFSSRIHFGKGIIINESSANYISESMKNIE